MGSSAARDRQREIERDQVTDDMWALRPVGWRVDVGRLAVRRHVGSQLFAKLFVLFNLCLGVFGGVLIFVGGSASDLGIALVVGALFSFGAFLTEVWSQTVDKEQAAADAIFGEERRSELRRLQEQRTALLAELDTSADATGGQVAHGQQLDPQRSHSASTSGSASSDFIGSVWKVSQHVEFVNSSGFPADLIAAEKSKQDGEHHTRCAADCAEDFPAVCPWAIHDHDRVGRRRTRRRGHARHGRRSLVWVGSATRGNVSLWGRRARRQSAVEERLEFPVDLLAVRLRLCFEREELALDCGKIAAKRLKSRNVALESRDIIANRLNGRVDIFALRAAVLDESQMIANRFLEASVAADDLVTKHRFQFRDLRCKRSFDLINPPVCVGS